MTNQTQNKSFILHKDSLSVLNKLTDEQAGKLFKSIFLYQTEDILPNDNLISIIFEPFLNQFRRDAENYKNTCEARKIAGSKGGKQKVANASKSKQKVANLADSDSKNKNDSENKNKNDLPIFINENLFDSFVKMRKEIKKPLTDEARKLLIKKLTRFENKQAGFANTALEDSIEGSWQGVYEPKNNFNNQPMQTKTDDRIEKLNKIAGFDLFKRIEENGDIIYLFAFDGHKVNSLPQDIKNKIKDFFASSNKDLILRA